MNSVQIELSPLLSITVPLDMPFGRAVFSDTLASQVEKHIRNSLKLRFRPGTVASSKSRGHAPLCDGMPSLIMMRIDRSYGAFEQDFKEAVFTLAQRLGDQIAEDEGQGDDYLLQLGWNDCAAFAKDENLFGDFLYLFGRVIKKRG